LVKKPLVSVRFLLIGLSGWQFKHFFEKFAGKQWEISKTVAPYPHNIPTDW
jgi:hypothetical protein